MEVIKTIDEASNPQDSRDPIEITFARSPKMEQKVQPADLRRALRLLLRAVLADGAMIRDFAVPLANLPGQIDDLTRFAERSETAPRLTAFWQREIHCAQAGVDITQHWIPPKNA